MHEKKITDVLLSVDRIVFEFLPQRRMALLVAQQLLVGATCVTASSVYNSASVQLQYVYDPLALVKAKHDYYLHCVFYYMSPVSSRTTLAAACGFPCPW